jgi:amylosucrase
MQDTRERAELSLLRVLPRLRETFREADREAWQAFEARLRAQFDRLFGLLYHLYGSRYDFFYNLEQILESAARLWLARPAELKELDAQREADPAWFQSESMLGGVCYVDLFAGTLKGVGARLPYFRELGLTYLHLMPLFAAPAGENDGGYAVSSYRAVNPKLGTMEGLAELAASLRHEGISLVLDFVFNHTSDEHEWARRAQAGDPEYQDYYFIFPDRTIPDAYQKTLREIFPGARPGSFTWRSDMGRWVWTTFYSFQWDLNYGNPAVFRAMMEEMLSLANQGVEVLRLDALAFTWKKLGTTCESLPEAHMLVQAYNTITRIAAPSLIFKSEAIVHPDEVSQYISPDECQISYNPLLMALQWEALATREVKLLRHSTAGRFRIEPGCAWVNYVRSHDDIGWTFDDADAAQVGVNGFDHRRFLNAFYTGRFPGSFSRGLPFQENPRTGDARVSGTCASLAGLEKAVREETDVEVDLAVRRILLMYSISLSIGGIPLIYLGDEIGTLNDYSYRAEPAKAGDSRWVHRPATDWDRMALRDEPGALESRIYTRLRELIATRKQHPAFAGNDTRVIDTGNPHVFGYSHRNGAHRADAGQMLVLASFSEQPQMIAANVVRTNGLGYAFRDLATGSELQLEHDLTLEPYQFMWLIAE